VRIRRSRYSFFEKRSAPSVSLNTTGATVTITGERTGGKALEAVTARATRNRGF